MRHLWFLVAAISLHGYQLRPISDIPALIQSLKDPNADRIAAVEALGQIGPDAKDALPILSEIANGREEPIGAFARDALGKMGDAGRNLRVAALLSALNDPDEDRRRHAAIELGSARPATADAVVALTRTLQDPSSQVRMATALTLRGIGAAAAGSVPSLMEALHDGDEEVRSVAADALGSMGTGGAVAISALCSVLHDSSVMARTSAARSLGQFGATATPAIRSLIEALQDPSSYVRLGAAASLGQIGLRDGAEAALRAALVDGNPDVRHAAARAVGAEPPEREDEHPERGVEPMEGDVATLLRFLNAGGMDGRRAAAGLLKLCEKDTFEGGGLVAADRVPGPWRKKCATAQFELPEAALRDEDLLIQRAAAEAVAASGERAVSVVSALVDAAGVADGTVRWNVLEALRNAGPAAAPAVPALLRLLEDGEGIERAEAAEALGAIGPAAEAAIPKLLDALRNHQEIDEVRAAALKSSAQIAPRENEVQKALRAGMTDASGSVRTSAFTRLKDSDPSGAVPMLAAALKDHDAAVRDIAVQDLLDVPMDASVAVPIFTAAAESEDGFVRVIALEGLQRLGAASKPALPRIIARMQDENPNVRQAAIWAIGAMGADAATAVPALIYALGQEDLRSDAAEALGKIGPAAEPAIPMLVRLLQQGDSLRRLRAAQALCGIGVNTAETKAALTAALADEHDGVREAASAALRKLGAAK